MSQRQTKPDRPRESPSGGKHAWRALRLALQLLLIAASLYAVKVTMDIKLDEGTFYPGVQIDGIALKGYTKQEAYDMLAAKNQPRVDGCTIRASFENQTWVLSPAEMKVSLDTLEKVEAAWELGRQGNIFERHQEISRLRSYPSDTTIALSYDRGAVEAFFVAVKKAVDRPAVDAQVEFRPTRSEKFSYEREVAGRDLDLNALVMEAVDLIDRQERAELTVYPRMLEPKLKLDELKTANKVIGTCRTPDNSATQDRSSNVKLALSNFQGYVLYDNEVLSFNEVVGQRTEERGYKIAPEYSASGVSDGVGGGVCQASTTLYGAVVDAGLEIRKRSNHSYTVNYVPLGMDAAVTNTSSKDLIFRNNTGLPIFFAISTGSDSFSVTIYGRKIDPNLRIETETKTLKELPKPSPSRIKDTEGKYVTYTDEERTTSGKIGYESMTYRVYYDRETGEEVRREQLSHDEYLPLPDKIYTGVTKRPSEDKPADAD